MKKSILLTSILLFIFSFWINSYSQDKDNPQKEPVLKPKTTETEWKEYVNDECGFKIVAIGLPKREKSSSELNSGLRETTTFEWQTPVAELAVYYTEYPVLPTDAESLKKQFDNDREFYTTKGLKLVTEKDVYLEKFLGREIIFESGLFRLKMRVFYIGNRSYHTLFFLRGMIPQADSSARLNAKSSKLERY